jgi:tripartite-type tricarboxylate transporter receptor subunit TctC
MTRFERCVRRSWRAQAAVFAAAALCTLTSASVSAQNYPNRAIRLIVPTAAGSLTDVVARKVADTMSRNMGQAMVVENIAGAAGIIATEQVVRAAKDGYTLAMVPSTHAILPALYKLSYDPVTSITPIIMIASAPLVLVVPPKVPAKNTAELIAYAKSKPDPITIGSPGVGTVIHLGSELFASATGIKWTHVPYKGNSGLTTDLVGGQIDAAFLGGASAVPFVRSGKLRAIAVSTPTRSSALPDVPTLEESGLPGFNVDVWIAIIGPAGLPQPIIDRVRAEAQRAMSDKAVQDYLKDQSVDVVNTTTEATVETFRKDVAKYTKVVKDANIKAE